MRRLVGLAIRSRPVAEEETTLPAGGCAKSTFEIVQRAERLELGADGNAKGVEGEGLGRKSQDQSPKSREKTHLLPMGKAMRLPM